MRAFLGTNILVQHLTGDPPEQAKRATRFLGDATALFPPDPVLAEVVYVLESFYELPLVDVARLARSVLAFRSIVTTNPALLRAPQVYEEERLAFADPYLIAQAEATGPAPSPRSPRASPA